MKLYGKTETQLQQVPPAIARLLLIRRKSHFTVWVQNFNRLWLIKIQSHLIHLHTIPQSLCRNCKPHNIELAHQLVVQLMILVKLNLYQLQEHMKLNRKLLKDLINRSSTQVRNLTSMTQPNFYTHYQVQEPMSQLQHKLNKKLQFIQWEQDL